MLAKRKILNITCIAAGLGFITLLMLLLFTDETQASRQEPADVSLGEIAASAMITPTNEWINFYSQSSYLNGELLPIGTVVQAYNQRGVLAGQVIVSKIGWYGLMPVYRDDPTTPADEGFRPGEIVLFRINNQPARGVGPDNVVWTTNGALKQVNLTASSIQATTEWVNFYSEDTKVNNLPVAVGSLIQAYDPQGILCGETIVTHSGWYGLLSCYADDPSTPSDEGAIMGDSIQFKIAGRLAQAIGPDSALWGAHGELRRVNLKITGLAATHTSTSTQTPTPTPTGTQPTSTFTQTPTSTPTGTRPTGTFTQTPTPTPTGTRPTSTFTQTSTPTPTGTQPTSTSTQTPTSTSGLPTIKIFLPLLRR